jgi:hypothetical protein
MGVVKDPNFANHINETTIVSRKLHGIVHGHARRMGHQPAQNQQAQPHYWEVWAITAV